MASPRTTRVTDPLESLKVAAPVEQAAPGSLTSPANEPVPSNVEEDVIVDVQPPKAASKAMRVVEKIKVAWAFGRSNSFVTFHKGDILSEENHGPGAIEYARSAGVKLEEIEET